MYFLEVKNENFGNDKLENQDIFKVNQYFFNKLKRKYIIFIF